MNLIEIYNALPWGIRILLIILFAAGGHFLLRGVRRVSEWIIDPSRTPEVPVKEFFARRHPKIATLTSLVVSALTFVLYFLALGLILKQFNVSLTAYLATASIVGLAVAFGAQGLVQDIVIGLTLLFSDVFDIGDMIEVSGQIGRVEEIGLRFTKIVNLLGQSVYFPNRNIALVGRYRKGAIRAYVDIQMPQGVEDDKVISIVDKIARGMREQFRAILVTDAEIFGIQETGPGGWRYLRIRFRLWPGQNAVIENIFRQRILAEMKSLEASYADWMITVTYRVS